MFVAHAGVEVTLAPGRLISPVDYPRILNLPCITPVTSGPSGQNSGYIGTTVEAESTYQRLEP